MNIRATNAAKDRKTITINPIAELDSFSEFELLDINTFLFSFILSHFPFILIDERKRLRLQELLKNEIVSVRKGFLTAQ